MRTRPTAKHRNGKVTIRDGKRVLTIDGEQAIRLAHDLMKAGESALRKTGKLKP